MENKIQELTNKLLREGVDKGNAEAERSKRTCCSDCGRR